LKISVIISTLNRPEDLKVSLKSILRQSHPAFEVIVVDQSDDVKTKQLCFEFLEEFINIGVKFKYIFQHEKSLVKSRNVGLASAEGDIISFFDDDIELEQDYLLKARHYFTSYPLLAGLSGNVIMSQGLFSGGSGLIRKALCRIFLLNFFNGRMTPSGFGYPIFERELNKCLKVQMLPGCNMNFRRSSMSDLRFDEWFTGYSFREDVDFSYRVSLRGTLLMAPDIRLYHHESKQNRLSPQQLVPMRMANYRYLFNKHKSGSLLSNLLFNYSLCGICVIAFMEFVSRKNQLNWSGFKSILSAVVKPK
jgi:glycosyltransferase involved in cell wall biosynthesis